MRVLRLLGAARSAIARVIPLMRDARVPFALKFGTAAFAILILSPIDIFGDIPILGALDDAALLTLLCMWFVARAERRVIRCAVPSVID
jgi:uncharacterized membrane protein YkvA (DUF1232 family)